MKLSSSQTCTDYCEYSQLYTFESTATRTINTNQSPTRKTCYLSR